MRLPPGPTLQKIRITDNESIKMNKTALQSLALVALLVPSLAYGGPTFDFNDATTQGWTLDQMYVTATQVKFTPTLGYTLGNTAGTLSASAAVLGIGRTNQNDIYLESPNLTSDAAWQGVGGYSVDLKRLMYSGCVGDLPGVWWAQLQARVIDTADGNKEKLFAEWNGTAFVFHEILTYGQLYHLVWNGWPLSDSRYIIKNVRLRITGPGEMLPECWFQGRWELDNVSVISGAGSQVTVVASDAVAGEPGTGQETGTFTFSRSGSTAAALTVNFTVGGTATSGSDYTALGTTVTFTTGAATATKTVSVLADSTVEGDETVVLTLASGSGYTVGSPASATVTIKDDATAPDTLLSCAGTPGGDFYNRGFYVPQYPGVSLSSARLELSAANAGKYTLTLTVRSNTYDGPILGVSTSTVSLSGDVYDNQPVIFAFPSTPIVKDSRVCFILSLISGPGMSVYYSVPDSGGCTEVVRTESTTPPLDTFRGYGVNLVLTGESSPQALLSCFGPPAGDFYDRGFYVPQYPGVSLNSAQLALSATTAGSYVMTLTVRSNTYNGPLLAVATTTVSLNGSITENQPVTFAFPSTAIAKYSRVCFILSLVSGPGTAVYYSVPSSGGCTGVVQTEGTTPPLDTFRRYGVNLVLSGVNDPTSDLRAAIVRQPAGMYIYWNSIAGRTYTIQTNSNLQLFNALQTGITATPPMNTFGPIVPLPTGRQFYRVMLEP